MSAPAPERVFGWWDHTALWFSLGVGLLVVQVGAYLVPAMGTQGAALAIVVGSIVGAGLLGWTARIACQHGLSSAGLMQATFGSGFARLPILLNMVQLVGWTTFELVVMRDGTQAVVAQVLGFRLEGVWGHAAALLPWGLVLVALLAGSMTKLVRRVVSHVALPLVVLSLLWLSAQFAARIDNPVAFWHRAGTQEMGWLSAMDLVVAMPASWLPLVADYARHGIHARGAQGGTWLGYAIANVWCYALGFLVASVAATDAGIVHTLLLAQGGLLALSLILIDELDNAYGDVYSCAVSGSSLVSRWPLSRWAVGLGAVCVALAFVLPMHALEPFLLLLSSVFVPLYGVILGSLGWQRTTLALDTVGKLAVDLVGKVGKVDWGAAGVWLGGVACYHAIANAAPQYGATLPTLALTIGATWAVRAMRATQARRPAGCA
ncbi:Purine-cytosine permease-like protein [Candidatus Symbiobacter mobilis CR]|uniref:Purine-cytosine permease-like protein n=1 Tax=Candidatus Symbiobacter mobilis CR TaxID=946483 RepID=U5NA28_9BURK|nr:Purine-cytosine permease-like protein [Candidatus Symbiobacter mobilis CR]